MDKRSVVTINKIKLNVQYCEEEEPWSDILPRIKERYPGFNVHMVKEHADPVGARFRRVWLELTPEYLHTQTTNI